MKRIITTSALLLCASATALLAGEVTQKFDRIYDFQPGTSLSLENENGSVTIHPWDKDAVHVVATTRVEGRGEEARKILADVKINVRADGKRLIIETKTPDDDGANGFFKWLAGKHVNVEVEYDVTVPRSLPLEVDTVNGHVKLSDVGGKLSLSTTNGRISVSNARGTLNAETTNGGIDAELTEVAPEKMELSTTNGGIVLRVPSTLKATLHASTTNGGISSDLPVTTKNADDNELNGEINGGGPSLELHTTNGGIQIRAAK